MHKIIFRGYLLYENIFSHVVGLVFVVHLDESFRNLCFKVLDFFSVILKVRIKAAMDD